MKARTGMLRMVLASTWLAAGVAYAADDPKVVFEAYMAGVNSGDIGAVERLIAPNPNRPPRNFCPPELANRDCLISYIKMTVVDQHTRLLPVRTVISADTIKVRLEVRNDLTRAAGVERFTGSDHITVRHGKIVSFAFVPDAHDPQTIKFFKYMRTTLKSMPGGGPPPGSLPGDAPAAR